MALIRGDVIRGLVEHLPLQKLSGHQTFDLTVFALVVVLAKEIIGLGHDADGGALVVFFAVLAFALLLCSADGRSRR